MKCLAMLFRSKRENMKGQPCVKEGTSGTGHWGQNKGKSIKKFLTLLFDGELCPSYNTHRCRSTERRVHSRAEVVLLGKQISRKLCTIYTICRHIKHTQKGEEQIHNIHTAYAIISCWEHKIKPNSTKERGYWSTLKLGHSLSSNSTVQKDWVWKSINSELSKMSDETKNVMEIHTLVEFAGKPTIQSITNKAEISCSINCHFHCIELIQDLCE